MRRTSEAVEELADYLVEEMMRPRRRRSYWYLEGEPGVPRADLAKAHQGRALPLSMLNEAVERVARALLIGGREPHRWISSVERQAYAAWKRNPVGKPPVRTSPPASLYDLRYIAEHGLFPPVYKTRSERARESGQRSGQARRKKSKQAMLLELPPGLSRTEQAARLDVNVKTITRWWQDFVVRSVVGPDDPRIPKRGGARPVSGNEVPLE